MKRLLITWAVAGLCLTSAVAQKGYPITPVPFTAVKVLPQSFWGQRLDACRTTTVPLAFSKCEETGRYTNFSHAAAHLKDASKTFKVGGLSFDDTDPYKTIEGASYLLQTFPDQAMAAYIDSVLDVIAAAQEADGYLYTARTQNPAQPHEWAGDRRWCKEEDLSHELYNLGHMVEAAIAHYQATGSRKFLDIAIRYADCVCREVGPAKGQACVVPGHQIAEMALAKLYLVTGDRKYLDEAKFFLDYRGKTTIRHDYSQAHRPVVEQDEAVGHAVRAAYMYAGMADVAALTGDSAYLKAIDRIWQNIVEKKLYITGGIGATSAGEAFGRNYELPNLTAYCETCAAIGLVYVNYRLFLLHGQAKYYDVLERTLYNGLISGMSLDGGAFFYPNPLASTGQHQRKPWFGCACCPSNLCRFIPSLPGYVYAVKEHQATADDKGGNSSKGGSPDVYVNLFVPGTATLDVGGKQLTLTQQTDYPWDGETTIIIGKSSAKAFNLKVRIPGWLRSKPVPSDLYTYADGRQTGFSVMINNITVPLLISPDGYVNIEWKWKKGDRVLLHFDMQPRIVKANDRVAADRGMVAVERGPLVYCAEQPLSPEGAASSPVVSGFPAPAASSFVVSGFPADISTLILPPAPSFTEGNAEIAGTKVLTLTTTAQALHADAQGRVASTDAPLTLIPYYAWCHRGPSNMRVWLPQDLRQILKPQ